MEVAAQVDIKVVRLVRSPRKGMQTEKRNPRAKTEALQLAEVRWMRKNQDREQGSEGGQKETQKRVMSRTSR